MSTATRNQFHIAMESLIEMDASEQAKKHILKELIKFYRAESETLAILDPKDQKIKDMTDARVAEKVAVFKTKLENVALINSTIEVILEDQLGSITAAAIVNKLDECRRSNNKYHAFIATYHYPGIKNDMHRRQLLKTVRAIYQLKLSTLNPAEKSKLISEIKYATICDHCGDVAIELVNRLNIQGFAV